MIGTKNLMCHKQKLPVQGTDWTDSFSVAVKKIIRCVEISVDCCFIITGGQLNS